MSARFAAVLSAIIVCITPFAAAAQSEGTKLPVAHDQVVSVNPFTSMFRLFNVEFERKISESATWGVQASTIGWNDARYVNANALFRFYPQHAALSGVYLGGRTGVYDVSVEHTIGGRAFGAGFEAGYSWLLGPKRNVDISLGFGLTRLFGGDLHGASLTIPNVRLLNVGVAF